MGNLTLDDRGRVLIPKDVRDKLNLRPGQRLDIKIQNNKAVLAPTQGIQALKKLKGRIQSSEIEPLNLKNIWYKT